MEEQEFEKLINNIVNNEINEIEELRDIFSEEQIKQLYEALKANTSVTKLVLFNQIGDEGAKAIADILKENTSITVLYLLGNQIGDEGAKVIADALKTNTSVTVLYLPGNQIGVEGAKVIADALKTNTTLTKLYLSMNQIGDEGAKAIADALKENTTLTELNLSVNDIGDEGAKAIADALKTNISIAELYLTGNQIGDEGAKAIAGALKTNTSVTELYLTGNQIGDEGAKAIADALKENTTVTVLGLSENQIRDEGAKAIADALEMNMSVRDIFLHSNFIGYEGGKYTEKNSQFTERNKKAAEDLLGELITWKDKEHTYEECIEIYEKIYPRLGLVKYIAKSQREKYGDLYLQIDDIYNICKEAKKENIMAAYGLNKDGLNECNLLDPTHTTIFPYLTDRDIANALTDGEMIKNILKERDAEYELLQKTKENVQQYLQKLQNIYKEKKKTTRLNSLENCIAEQGEYALPTLVKYLRSMNSHVRKVLVEAFVGLDKNYADVFHYLKYYVDDKKQIEEIGQQIKNKKQELEPKYILASQPISPETQVLPVCTKEPIVEHGKVSSPVKQSPAEPLKKHQSVQAAKNILLKKEEKEVGNEKPVCGVRGISEDNAQEIEQKKETIKAKFVNIVQPVHTVRNLIIMGSALVSASIALLIVRQCTKNISNMIFKKLMTVGVVLTATGGVICAVGAAGMEYNRIRSDEVTRAFGKVPNI